ncbi:valine--tRNA ligase [Desulfoluna spongiiphila]|uniref:Valine--tRNA ligase n=1 Tax=Desulfoluna spongiiphila TaxID=419481 RepID=A0A1G5DAT3_9BACT|nr:valine--tRNA ligase [Desulfoluna spongiiphila]SCY11647.1 valyl-tRNA synthetase [Desulfoluna spongiiphila]
MSGELLAKGYEPHEVEKRCYASWIEQGLFSAEETSDKKPYSIVIPPPNVTGVLHMGHALNNTLQDLLCRYRRLKGDNVLWMPGTDHAGIATQNVVEKKLAAEGRTRHEVGREAFIDEVWKWKEESGNAIFKQLKRMGASCDWDRERFTMDDGLSEAVRKVFVDLYKKGLIYRGNYIINWCPRCNTALADLEVEHEDKPGKLYHLKYPFADGSGHFVVATTRPETMFGDTAVAVNPEDDRYKGITATHVKLPLTDREIPIIRDEYVDLEFGTGALKVTPAHDPNDFELGKKHNLESLKVMTDEGVMNDGAGAFEGLTREACREAAVKALDEQGYLVKVEDHPHSVGHCYRCKTVIEPNLSQQWFVKVKPLAEKAIAAVEDGRTRIIPEHWTKTYYEWMYNIRDWCISRQIWWGHRIPVWTCDECGMDIVEETDPTVCPGCGSTHLTQDTDVLDTWFSSALWPFSTMGWPENTDLLKTFYPTSTLVTGFDILFFWVARMMMMGLHFMDEVPFKDVYIHALVRDEEGKKMSKSKGNVIDPLTVSDEYGTDAFRFTLTAFAAQGRDVKMSLARVEGYRHFINKIWNAARFSFMHLEQPHTEIDYANISLADRWILARLAETTAKVEEAIDTYKFNEAAAALYSFVWHSFCDWYLEASKPALYGKMGDAAMESTRSVLYRVLHDTLILLHPIIPFVSEEIYSKLPGTEGSIMKASWPVCDEFAAHGADAVAEKEMESVIAVISGLRNIRSEMNIAPSLELTVEVQAETEEMAALVNREKSTIMTLSRLASCEVKLTGERPKGVGTAIVEGAAVYVFLEGVVDFDREIERLEKSIAKSEKAVAGLEGKLNNQGFISKAPADVVAKFQAQHDEAKDKLDKLAFTLQKLKDVQSN